MKPLGKGYTLDDSNFITLWEKSKITQKIRVGQVCGKKQGG